MDRGRGKGNVVNLEEIINDGEVEKVGEGDTAAKATELTNNIPPLGLIRGKKEDVAEEEDVFSADEEDDDDFNLEKLKNLKIMTESDDDKIEEDANINDLDGAIERQLAVMASMKDVYEELKEEEGRINDITVVGGDEEDEADNVEVKRVPINETFEDDDYADEESDFDAGMVDEDEELVNARNMKREEDGVKVGVSVKSDNSKTIKDGKGNVKKKTQARIQGNLARLRNAVNMAGAYHDTYLPKSNLIFRAYKPANSIALDNRTIQGNWVTAGRDRLRATLKEFYENGILRCAENISFEVFLRSISYRDLKYINCGIASTIVDKWEMDIGLCKHVDEDGPCNASKEPEVITLPIKDILQKSYKAEEVERFNRYDNTKTITELQAETLFGQCEVFSVDLTNNDGERTGVMNVYTSEASVERFLSVMRAVDDYLISILVDERPDMRAIAGNLNSEELLYQVTQMLPERAQEAYGVALVMLGIDKIELGTVGENQVVEFKVDDVKSYEELFELFTIIDNRIMNKIGTEEREQELSEITTFKIKYRRKCKHVTTVSIASELVLNLPRRVLSV